MPEVTIIITDDVEENAEDGLNSVTITVRSDSDVPDNLVDASPAQQYADMLLRAAQEQSTVFALLDPTLYDDEMDPREVDE